MLTDRVCLLQCFTLCHCGHRLQWQSVWEHESIQKYDAVQRETVVNCCPVGGESISLLLHNSGKQHPLPLTYPEYKHDATKVFFFFCMLLKVFPEIKWNWQMVHLNLLCSPPPRQTLMNLRWARLPSWGPWWQLCVRQQWKVSTPPPGGEISLFF